MSDLLPSRTIRLVLISCFFLSSNLRFVFPLSRNDILTKLSRVRVAKPIEPPTLTMRSGVRISAQPTNTLQWPRAAKITDICSAPPLDSSSYQSKGRGQKIHVLAGNRKLQVDVSLYLQNHFFAHKKLYRWNII